MANVNITQRPTTVPCWTWSSPTSTNGEVQLSMDPNGSPVYFTFSTDVDGYTGYNSSYEFMLWNVLGVSVFPGIPAGETLTLYGVELRTADNPGSREWFSCGSDLPSRINSAQSLATLINSDPDLRWRVTASVRTQTSGSLTFIIMSLKARYPGDNYSFAPDATLEPTNPSPSPNRITWSYAFDPPATQLPGSYVAGSYGSRGQRLAPYDYSVWLEVWRRPLKQFGSTGSPALPALVATLSSPWDFNNAMTFDVSQYLTTDSVTFPPTAPFIDPGVYKEDAVVSYFLRYGEQFSGGLDLTTGLPAEQVDSITNRYVRKYEVGFTEDRWTFSGAFPLDSNDPTSQQYWAQVTETGANSSFYRPTYFWTQQPAHKLRRRMADREVVYPEYLYFFWHNDGRYSMSVDFLLRTTFTFVDGTTSTRDTHQTVLNESGLYRINVNFPSVGLDAEETLAGKRVMSYTHQAFADRFANGTAAAISWPISYDVDLNYEPNRYVKFWWRSPLGLFDQFEFEGVQSQSLTSSPVQLLRSPSTSSGYHRDRHRRGYLETGTQMRFKASTGWVDAEHVAWLRQMLDSTEVLVNTEFLVHFGVIYLTRQLFLAVNVVDFTYEADNDARLFDVSITFEASVQDNNIRS